MEKPTITIVTLNDPTNYGNRLQNYALTSILEQYGSVTTAYSAVNRLLPAKISKIFHSSIRAIKLLERGIKTHSYKVIQEREKKCVAFTKKYVPQGVGIDVYKGVTPKSKISEWYVFGSDQIWNYSTVNTSDRLRGFSLFLGSFAQNGMNLISYAASIGTSSMAPEPVIDAFQRYIPRFKAVSMREYRGSELIKEMTGRESTVVLDPTLMINADQWLAITEHFVSDNDNYILTYFLGRPSPEQEKTIQEQAKKLHCRIRRILDLSDLETYVAGPQDFVELFSKAKYVFTDSYHACCFSIIFHKQFTVFQRSGMSGKANMNSRMETLFTLFDLKAIVMESGVAPEIEYEKVDVLLQQHREKSRNWLNNALESN